jgi:hypothetical protein
MIVLITNKARQDFYYNSVLNFVIKWLSISVRKRNERPRYLPPESFEVIKEDVKTVTASEEEENTYHSFQLTFRTIYLHNRTTALFRYFLVSP